MVAIRVAALLALSGTCHGTASFSDSDSDSEHQKNPIRRVVTMLQQMSNKVAAEGKKEKELFDKFMCYCSNGADDLAASINAADTKIPQVEASLKEGAANKVQLEADVKQHGTDRVDANAAIASATALREKENAEYAKESTKEIENIAMLDKAIKAIGMLGAFPSAFLQTTAASSVRRLAIDMNISPGDRDQVMAFLAQGQGFGYTPKNPQVVGILKQMQESMEEDLAEVNATETKAIGIYDDLVASKKKEITAATAAIENKMERIGNLGVEIETMKADLGDTGNSLIEDKKFLADLDKTCKTKQAEWDERCKVRNQELLALADTIKMLNDDDALELFKKTLPGASFLQTKVTSKEVRKEVLQALAGQHGVKLDLISLALHGKKMNFDEVIKMVDDMVVLLKKEQQDDDAKKEMCEMQLDKSEDDLKVLETTISDLEKSLADGKEEIATLTDEIAALSAGLAELDKQVEEATVNRKEENEDYQSLMANNGAALEIIGMAKNRLNKFYNPALVPASFVQVRMHKAVKKDAPPPPPATWDAYSKKSEESNGVVAMMDNLIADLEKEMQEAELEEKEAQGDYEQFTRDAAEKRVQDSKSITEKEGAKAEAEVNLVKETQERQTKRKEALATVNFIGGLHKDCDWLLGNYGVRKSARVAESEALGKARAVLSGADFSLVQTNSKFLRARK